MGRLQRSYSSSVNDSRTDREGDQSATLNPNSQKRVRQGAGHEPVGVIKRGHMAHYPPCGIVESSG